MTRYSHLISQVRQALIDTGIVTNLDNLMWGETDSFIMQPDTFYPRFEYSIFHIGTQEYISQGEINETVMVTVNFVMTKDTTKTIEENSEALFLALESAKGKIRELAWNKSSNGLSSYGFQYIEGKCETITEQNFMNGLSMFVFGMEFLYTNLDTKIYQ